MANVPQATVAVEYRFIEDYHVFTSRDVYGLYVASTDPHKACDAIAPAIQHLLNANERSSCVETALSLRARLLETLRKPGSTSPEQLGPRQFVLRPAA